MKQSELYKNDSNRTTSGILPYVWDQTKIHPSVLERCVNSLPNSMEITLRIRNSIEDLCDQEGGIPHETITIIY